MVYDVSRLPPIKVTFDRGRFSPYFSPLWTPDGRRLVVEATEPRGLVAVAADGSDQTPEQVSVEGHFHPHAWSPDGRDLIAVELHTQGVDGTTAATDADIVRWPPGAPVDRQPVVQTPANKGFEGVSLSPDGGWLAYVSHQTGQPEVWVRPYPGPGASVRVSPNGGVEPVWSMRGDELYYLEGIRMMAVSVSTGATFAFKAPRVLFESPYKTGSQPPSYDVAADGRFLMIKRADAQSRNTPQLVLVLNWTEELKRLVPTK